MHIPKTHPRYLSLITREKLVEGYKLGVTALQGLIAHGRGETFDYILGEKSHEFALKAEKAAVAEMLLAKHPVISVNGNVAVLVPEDVKELAEVLNAKIEVNVFHWSKERVEKIKNYLKKFGIDALASQDAILEGLDSARRFVDSKGIYIADVVLVPLEDGDRCEILKKHGKKVVAIDLNPLSRTSQMADYSIVDNVVRAIPNMVRFAKELKELDRRELRKIVDEYNNNEILKNAILAIRDHLLNKASSI